jgi:hypothetical protein
MQRRTARVAIHALLLLLAGAFALAVPHPARAQGGGSLVYTIPGPDWDEYDFADLQWSWFHRADADCPRNFLIGQPIDELSLVLDVDMEGGTVSGSLNGALRHDWEEDTEPAWAEATFVGSMSGATLERSCEGVYRIDDCIRWRFDGQMRVDVTASARFKCSVSPPTWLEETHSAQAILYVQGFVVGDKGSEGWSVRIQPPAQRPDPYLDLALSGSLPAGFLPPTTGDLTPTAGAAPTAVQAAPTTTSATPTPLPAQPGQAGTTPTPGPVCTPPPCAAGEIYYCPGSCPGGCGTECATPTPVSPATESSPEPTEEAGSFSGLVEELVDDVAEAVAGSEREPPSPGRAAAAVGASGALAAAAAGARIALTRAPRGTAGKDAPVEGGSSAPGASAPPVDAVAPQANSLLARRAALSAEVQAALARVTMLNRRRAQLADLYRRTEAEWNYTRWTGFTDGVINVIDLTATVLNPSSSVALAGVLSAAKQGAKGRLRDAVGAAYGVPSRGGADATDSLLSGLGLPTGIASPGGALKQWMINRGSAQGRAAARRALDLNRRRSYDAMRRASRHSGVAQGLGQGLNVIETSASLVSDFADSSRRMAALRQRMMRVYDQQLTVGRALDTARMDLQVARSAYEANEAAIRQLKAQFPQRFAHL